MTITLVTGGARSGKSRFAEYLAETRVDGGEIGYLATGVPVDAEMTQRIEQHQARRGTSFVTIEEPYHISQRILRGTHSMYLVDCLSFLLNNWIYELDYTVQDVQMHIEELRQAARKTSSDVIFVTNEVGMGLVPPSPESRMFRDWLGWLNQAIAREADEVYLVVAGYAVNLKDLPGVTMVP